jgi:Putative beta-barrel porin 2
MKRSSTFLLSLLGLSLYVIVPDATAEMSFHPSISLRESYDDNIFLTSNNRKDDFITTITPNFNLDYKGNRLDLSLNYGVGLSFYAKNSDENQVNQTATLKSQLSIVRDALFLKVDDIYGRIPIDQRKQTTFDSLLVNTTDTNTLRVNPYLALPLSSKISYNLGYTYENIWYESNVGNNTQNHILATGLSLQLSEGMDASVNYSYMFHRPTQLTDEYDMQNVSLGLKYQVTPKLSLNGTVGGTSLRYRIATGRDTTSPVWSAQGDYRLTEKLSFHAGYAVDFSTSASAGTSNNYYSTSASAGTSNNYYSTSASAGTPNNYSLASVDAGTSKNYSWTAGIKYDASLPLTIVFFQNEAKYMQIINNRVDRSSGVRVDTSLPLSAKMSLKIGGMYTHYKFLPDDERADRYNAQASIEYAMNIATFSLGYTYNSNDSNINTNDYRDNIVFIQTKLSF